MWLPGKLTAQVGYLLKHPDTGIVFGGFELWPPQADGTFSGPPTPYNANSSLELVGEYSGWIYKDLLLDSLICIITAMVRRTVIETIGNFDESLRTGEDYDFWLRASRKFRADKLDLTLAYYRLHAASTTKVPLNESSEYKVLQRTLALYGPEGPDKLAATQRALRVRLFKLCFDHGYLHIRSGSPKIAQHAFGAAIAHMPLKPKTWVYWLLAAAKRLFLTRPSVH